MMPDEPGWRRERLSDAAQSDKLLASLELLA